MKTLDEILALLDSLHDSQGAVAHQLKMIGPAAFRQQDAKGNNITHLRPYQQHLRALMWTVNRENELEILKATKNHAGHTHYDIVFGERGHSGLMAMYRKPVGRHLASKNLTAFREAVSGEYLKQLEGPDNNSVSSVRGSLMWVETLVNAASENGTTALSYALMYGNSSLLGDILDNLYFELSDHLRALLALILQRESLSGFSDLLIVAKFFWHPKLPLNIANGLLEKFSDKDRLVIAGHLDDLNNPDHDDEWDKLKPIRFWRDQVGNEILIDPLTNAGC